MKEYIQIIYKQEIQRIKAEILREPCDGVAGNLQGIFPLTLIKARDTERRSWSSEWETRENHFYFNLLNIVEKVAPHILQSSAKDWKYKIKSYLRLKYYGKIISFNEYLGFSCYHTSWQDIAPTDNEWNGQAKEKFQAFRYLNKIYKKAVSALRL